jgi:hypothetical protein
LSNAISQDLGLFETIDPQISILIANFARFPRTIDQEIGSRAPWMIGTETATEGQGGTQ